MFFYFFWNLGRLCLGGAGRLGGCLTGLLAQTLAFSVVSVRVSVFFEKPLSFFDLSFFSEIWAGWQQAAVPWRSWLAWWLPAWPDGPNISGGRTDVQCLSLPL